ncbi:hypothetical protein G205_09148 [Arthrobacter nitrophenolicus]|uniref:Uncharacterized protein n=1 Tax=Arthrobacter nitrophenolicus TaxID=683150 RepID=L8TQ48_9MICC|nr:hypothetical protein G205_09148 [Arthrobacter nitrophenolicus]
MLLDGDGADLVRRGVPGADTEGPFIEHFDCLNAPVQPVQSGFVPACCRRRPGSSYAGDSVCVWCPGVGVDVSAPGFAAVIVRGSPEQFKAGPIDREARECNESPLIEDCRSELQEPSAFPLPPSSAREPGSERQRARRG